ncbi:hypothetical protein B0J13DRAFT_616866 [Dactylonectria estremocensis]|uniref:Uncharacterized protein n=1 Tax=Dactylonectria estremocensis TaxID=1079267 RepID=A0A9P9FFN0_9HYPO|nr:hypothetical protein B0J13DRAFT_616866 [Dactylonectria estremocensis]
MVFQSSNGSGAPKSRPRPKRWGLQAQRTLRRRGLAQRHLIRKQVSQGRPDPRKTWCGDPDCTTDISMFENPFKHLIDRERNAHGLLVSDYYRDFANAMVGQLFPETTTPLAKARKRYAVLSFVDSPPIKVALWKLMGCVKSRNLRACDEEIQAELVKAQLMFHDLMFGEKSVQTIETVHRYISPGQDELDRTWRLSDFALRFLIWAELWRSWSCRSAEWYIGPGEVVAEFLTAVLLNYWLMYFDDCFIGEVLLRDQRWDRVWEAWLEKYPVVRRPGGGNEENGGVEKCSGTEQGGGNGQGSSRHEPFVTREELGESEEVVLEMVGYLGGVGKYEGYCERTRLGLRRPSPQL